MVEPESQCFSLAMKSCTVAGTKENVVILTLLFFLINMTSSDRFWWTCNHTQEEWAKFDKGSIRKVVNFWNPRGQFCHKRKQCWQVATPFAIFVNEKISWNFAPIIHDESWRPFIFVASVFSVPNFRNCRPKKGLANPTKGFPRIFVKTSLYLEKARLKVVRFIQCAPVGRQN